MTEAVFLRILEYYSGILILTTNRVGTMDEAFQSRIHTMIYYPRLGYDQTREIFAMNIKRLNDIEKQRMLATGQPAIDVSEDDIMGWAREHFNTSDESEKWNGRQIRNAFQVASSMARYDWYKENPSRESEVPPTITAKHFERIARVTRDFHLYLREARGKDAWELSQEHNERADDFNLRNPYPDHWQPPRARYQNRPPVTGHGSYEPYSNDRYRRGVEYKSRYDDEDDHYRDHHPRRGHAARDSPDTPMMSKPWTS